MSWAYSADPDEIHEVSRWPFHERRGQDEVQIPSLIDLASDSWGYLIPPESDPCRWFKLLLLNTEDMQSDVRYSQQLCEARNKIQAHLGYESDGVIDVIARFLGHIWQHALEEIAREIEVGVLPLRVAVTIPAIWPNYAREKMKAAVKKAGILAHRPVGKTRLILVEEPEAAAMCTLFDRRNYPDIDVRGSDPQRAPLTWVLTTAPSRSAKALLSAIAEAVPSWVFSILLQLPFPRLGIRL